MRNLGFILLAIWLILTGLVALVKLNIPGGETLLAILAVAAGVVLLLGDRSMKWRKNLGMLLLAVWLIATGLIALLGVRIPSAGLILAILAIAAGVVLLLRR